MAGHSDVERALPRFDAPAEILIVIADYYAKIAASQLASARRVIEAAGAAHDTVEVTGSLEIAPAITLAHRLKDYHGYVALGCVIRGRTSHYDIVIGESARGLTLLGLQGLAIGNGIITVENMEQAEERADAARLDTAGAAAAAAVHLVALQRRWAATGKGIGFRAGRDGS